MSRRSLPRARRRASLPLLLSLVLALGVVVGLPVRASADGPTTFSNTGAITIPGAGGTPSPVGPASPYPSTIAVSDMAGAVTKVQVTFANLTHPIANDIDAMVVAPGGENLVLMSDATSTGTFTFASNATLTFDDAAAAELPVAGAIASGPYRPTNRSIGAADAFPAPAPTPSSDTTLAGAFTGLSTANGTWSLFIVDDTQGDAGTMAGGWSLTITTELAAVSTTTALTSSDTSSTTGQNVTFTATVAASDGSALPAGGTVQFADGSTNLGAAVPVNAAGVATLTTGTLTEGDHVIRATYSGAPGYLTSTRTLAQRVDNATVVTDTTFCNTGVITAPDSGNAVPYPSNVFVTGLSGQVTKVVASLRGLSHSTPIDLDVLLSGPTPTRNVILLSDAGGEAPVSNVNVTFDDAAAAAVPAPLVSGTFRPTDLDPAGSPADAFPVPAPTVSGATELSTFNGVTGNGTWSLWVRDDATGDAGSIAGGWCLTITSQDPTETALTASPNPSSFGQEVTFTATVTDASDDPVTEGTVQFRDGATALGSPVAVDDDGTATFTTAAASPLSVGTHPITAAYSGTTDLAESSASLDQVVNRATSTTALASSVNPSDVGESVTFTATVTAGGSPLTTGSVQFAVDGTDAGAAVAVSAAGQATFTIGTLTAGTHEIAATYGGTTSYEPSADDLEQVVEKFATTTTLVSSVNPSDFAESVTFTATVTSDGAPASGGTVQFSDGGAPLGAPAPVAADGTTTLTTAALTVGSHPIRAAYSGTPALEASTSDELDQVVGQAISTTTVTSSQNPSVFGQSVTFTATVTSPAGAISGGSVQFSVDGTDVGTAVALAGDGTAALAIPGLTAGTRAIVATFSGTTEIAGSTGTFEQTVDPAASTTVVGSSDPTSLVAQTVTFTATVTSSVPLPTGGTVQFMDDGTPLGAPVPLGAGGTATLDVSDLPAGTHVITATYSGGPNVAGNTSDPIIQVVNRTSTETSLATSGSPSGFGVPVTFTATVTTDPAGDPVGLGAVTFFVDGAPVQVATDVDANGVATFVTDDLSVGSHTIRADYLENASLGASQSPDLTQIVEILADARGPYTVAEGSELALDGSASSTAGTLDWDVNGDGVFGDATGADPILTWADLESLGITDGPGSWQVSVRVTAGAQSATSAATTLTVTNTAPSSYLKGDDLTATVGEPFSVNVGADDPSSADMAALFTYTVDWGDGSPVASVVGPADPPVTHTYTSAGDYAAVFTATDKDGGTGPGTRVVVVAQVADDPDDGDDDPSGDSDSDADSDSDLASTGSAVGLGPVLLGLALLVAGGGVLLEARRRRRSS